MAKPSRHFICQSCGASYAKWLGQCEACQEWNSIVEEAAPETLPSGLGRGAGLARGRKFELADMKGETRHFPRLQTGLQELDRATGGGLVPGSAILIGGDPGIGKSTILLQAVANLSTRGAACVYISGEEAIAQVQMRARRLGLDGAPVKLGAETNLRDILATLDAGVNAAGNAGGRPQLVVIDSIQTMFVDNLDSAPGTVAQVRASAQELIRFAKKRNICMILVGHVTKEGQIAGPRVLEHMVDTVLYFEGERGHQFRILRAVKNRFGAADEIGVFEMTDAGLREVTNPSSLFLSNRESPASGSAVFAGIEGSRPMLVEIQALVAQSSLGTPRRAVVGWDSSRLAMILAVLDARCGLGLGGQDVYLNVAGGLRIGEPAADLAVAAALVSSFTDRPLPTESVVFGEISLSGEVRSVAQTPSRLKEAAKLGFERAYMPANTTEKARGIQCSEFSTIQELVDLVAGIEH